MELFKVFGSIFISDSEADKSLDNIEKKAKGTDKTLGEMIKTAAKVGAGIAVGLAAAGTAVVALATKTSKSMDRIDKDSQKLGLSRAAFQEWDFVLSQSGASIDSMGAGIKTMTALLEDANQGGDKSAEVFQRLGLSLDDVTNMSREQAFMAITVALQDVEDETEKATLAQQALGRAGQELMPLLNSTSEELHDMRDQAYELGLVMGDDAIDAGVAFTDTMDQLQRTIGSTIATALAPFLPLLNDLMQQLIALIPPLMGFIQPLAEKLIPVVQRIIEALLPVFIRLLDAIIPLLFPLIDLFVELLDTGLMPLIETLLPLITELLPPLIDLLIALIPVILPVINVIIKLINIALKVLVNEILHIVNMVLPMLTVALEKIPTIFESVKNKVLGIMDALKSGFKSGVNFVVDMLNKFIGSANTIIGSLNAVPGVNLPTIPTIPGLAKGGTVTGSGSVLVGEQGPELLDLPRGARVTPLDKAGGGVNVYISGNTIMGDRDADRFGDLIVKRLRVLGVNA